MIGFADIILDLGVDFEDTTTLLLIAIPFGLGAAYIFYYVLNRKWKSEIVIEKDEILNIGQDIEDL